MNYPYNSRAFAERSRMGMHPDNPEKIQTVTVVSATLSQRAAVTSVVKLKRAKLGQIQNGQ